MNEAENKTSDALETVDIQQECASLRKQVNLLLLSLVVLSLTLTAFFYLHVRRTSKDLDAIRPQAMQVIEARKRDGPIIQNFMEKLTEYAGTHSEFAARLSKQGLKLGSNTNTPSPAFPAPAIAPPAR